MSKYRLRMIYQGRVTQETVVEAATPKDAWDLAHPPKADPCLMAAQGKPAAWVEVTAVGEGA